MSNVPRRKGRPSRQDQAVLRQRPWPVGRIPEGAHFRLLRAQDEPADVEHYWVRRSFYAALRAYAPFAYEDLTRAAAEVPESGFPFSIGEKLEAWCHHHRFFAVAGDRQIPEWFELD